MAGSKGVTDFLGIKPEYGAIGSQDIADTAREFASVLQGNALNANAKLKAQADIKAAQHYADAQGAMVDSAGGMAAVDAVTQGVEGLGRFMHKGGLFNNSTGLSPAMGIGSINAGFNMAQGLFP